MYRLTRGLSVAQMMMGLQRNKHASIVMLDNLSKNAKIAPALRSYVAGVYFCPPRQVRFVLTSGSTYGMFLSGCSVVDDMMLTSSWNQHPVISYFPVSAEICINHQ